MKVKELKDIHYPVEYLIFKCRNNEEARRYLQVNEQVWTKALSQYPGFVSSTGYINEDNPGEVHIVIIWKTKEEWFSVPTEDLMKIGKEFDSKFGLPYENGKRLHNDNNFGWHKVRHFEVER